jgi:hypothetical protein
MTWQNALKAATNFVNRAIAGIALWSDANAKWSDPLFTWGDIGIQYTNEPKSEVTIPASEQPFGAWLFWFTTGVGGSTSPIAWNYETKH